MKTKKIACILMCAVFAVWVAGYEAGEKTEAPVETVSEVPVEAVQETVTETVPEVPDVDLTLLSSTMVYSEVYNMMCYPENYIGKSVKMNGSYTSFYDEATDKHYCACIIMDATACCAQGIEFELADDHLVYPQDYPNEGDPICVVGTFETYNEGENRYCTLRDATFI